MRTIVSLVLAVAVLPSRFIWNSGIGVEGIASSVFGGRVVRGLSHSETCASGGEFVQLRQRDDQWNSVLNIVILGLCLWGGATVEWGFMDSGLPSLRSGRCLPSGLSRSVVGDVERGDSRR